MFLKKCGLPEGSMRDIQSELGLKARSNAASQKQSTTSEVAVKGTQSSKSAMSKSKKKLPMMSGSKNQKKKSPSKARANKKALKTEALKGTPLGDHRNGFAPMRVDRFLTEAGKKPLEQVKYVKASSAIKDTYGKAVFEMKEVEVPKDWSQLSVDILVSKYFRKAGVPLTGHETGVKQVVHRIAHTLAHYGLEKGYFDKEGAITLKQTVPLDMTVLALDYKVSVGQ